MNEVVAKSPLWSTDSDFDENEPDLCGDAFDGLVCGSSVGFELD